MIANNISPDVRKNREFKSVRAANAAEGNRAWLKRVISENEYADQQQHGLLLIGGSSIPDFHLRVAQSYLRHDLSPSHWSQAGILIDAETFYSVPLQWSEALEEMPRKNGVQICNLADYDDPKRYPNFAFVQFTENHAQILKYAERLKLQRSSVIDLVALMISWLEYVWGVRQKKNPLFDGEGIPSAVFAEAVYGICGIELTPGLETSSSCPESIWQAAKWWSSFYAESSKIAIISTQARSIVPRGCFTIRQGAAAIYEKPYTAGRRGGSGGDDDDKTSRAEPKKQVEMRERGGRRSSV